MRRLAFALWILMAGGMACHAQNVTGTQTAQQPGSNHRVFGSDVTLPAEGIWQLGTQTQASRDVHYYLTLPKAATTQFTGVRMAKVMRQKNIDAGRRSVQRPVSPCLDFAHKNNGKGPSAISDLKEKRYAYLVKSLEKPPWRQPEYEDLEGPFVFLLPDVIFKFEDEGNGKRVSRENRTVLALELRPFIDDGKHWVAYTDYSSERVPIDAELVRKYELTIRPVLPKDTSQSRTPPTSYTYRLIVVCDEPAKQQFFVNLRNPISDKTLTVVWDTTSATPGGDALLNEMKKARSREWTPYLRTRASAVLPLWHAVDNSATMRRNARGRRGQSTSTMGVLGGRAAMRETLQMQALVARTGNEDRNISVNTLDGVQVKSHPYTTLLKGQPGGTLALAQVVPDDHFFLYIAQPETMLAMLEDGADFMSQLGGSMADNHIKYYLKARYLARLGLDENWLKLFLKADAVKECALVAPDLFFIDGTEITAVSRLSNPALIVPLLNMIGVSGLAEGKLIESKGKNGKPVFWALRRDLLTVSTSRSEIRQILALIDYGGKGSLGASAESVLTHNFVRAQSRTELAPDLC